MKKLLICLAIIGVIFTTYQIAETYAVFESNINVPTESSLADWNITVNDSMINGEVNTFNIDNINWTTSPNVLEGKAAPGLSADFNILIDPGNTEVAIRYDLTLNFDEVNNDEITLTNIEDLNGNILTKTGDKTYSAIITLDEIRNNTDHNIKVNLLWNNNDENNEADSNLTGSTTSLLEIPVTLQFSQYLGEELIEYIG